VPQSLTQAVWKGLHPPSGAGRMSGISAKICSARIAQAIQSSDFSVLDVNDSDMANEFTSPQAGELAAVRLALDMHVPVLMDDKLGRAFARHHGVAAIGIGGVLLAAKQAGYVAAARPLLDQIRGGGYHLSQALMIDILQRCGEVDQQA